MSDRRLQLSRVAPRLTPQLLLRRQAEHAERLRNLALRTNAGLRKTVDRARLTFDPRAQRLAPGALRLLERKRSQLGAVGPKVSPNALRSELRHSQSLLTPLVARLRSGVALGLSDRRTGLNQAGKLLLSLSYKSVLARGYAVIKDASGQLVHERAALSPGDGVSIEFADGAVDATIAGITPLKKKSKPQSDSGSQESLF